MKEKILNYIGQDGLLHILCCIVLVSVIDIVLPLWLQLLQQSLSAWRRSLYGTNGSAGEHSTRKTCCAIWSV